MSIDNANQKNQNGADPSSDRTRFDAELKSRREAAHGDPDKLKLYDMVAKVGEKNPAAASRIFDVFEAAPLTESKLVAAVRAGNLEKIGLMTPNANGTGADAEYNANNKTILLAQTKLEDANPKTREDSLLRLAQSTAHEGQHAVEAKGMLNALNRFDAAVNETISRDPNGPRNHTQAAIDLLSYKRTAEGTAEVEGFNAVNEVLRKRAEKEGKPFDLGYIYESYLAMGDQRMTLYIQKNKVEGQEGVFTYSMKPGIEIDENLKMKSGEARTAEGVAKQYYDEMVYSKTLSDGTKVSAGYPEAYAEGVLSRVDYIERERGMNYPGNAQIIVETGRLPGPPVPENIDRALAKLNYDDPTLKKYQQPSGNTDSQIGQTVTNQLGNSAASVSAAGPTDVTLKTTASSAEINQRDSLLSQAATAVQASGIAKDMDTQQRANLEAGVARLAQDNKIQQIAGVTQGANGQAIVYDGTSDHARRAAFDPKALGQTPADVSIAMIDRNASQVAVQNNETKQRAPHTV